MPRRREIPGKLKDAIRAPGIEAAEDLEAEQSHDGARALVVPLLPGTHPDPALVREGRNAPL
jgi:hypothetical protein